MLQILIYWGLLFHLEFNSLDFHTGNTSVFNSSPLRIANPWWLVKIDVFWKISRDNNVFHIKLTKVAISNRARQRIFQNTPNSFTIAKLVNKPYGFDLSVFIGLARSAGVPLLVVHALKLCTWACEAEWITGTLKILTPTNHLSMASVWEPTSTFYPKRQIAINEPQQTDPLWYQTHQVAFINNISKLCIYGTCQNILKLVFGPLAFSLRDRSDLWSLLSLCVSPLSNRAIRVEKEGTNAWWALSHWSIGVEPPIPTPVWLTAAGSI